MRVHVDERPRIESTNTSSMARCFAALACLLFQRSSPSSAACLSGELATTIRGIFVLGGFLAFDGATRGASPSILRKCGGQGASAMPAASSAAANSSSLSSEPGNSSIFSCGLPCLAKSFGIVRTVKSAGSQSGTSCHRSGADTLASGSGRTEYAEQVVRSLAFWL